MKRKVVLFKVKEGMWSVSCPAIGAHSQGDDYDDALRMIKECCELQLEEGMEADMDADPVILIDEIEISDDAGTPKGFRALSISFGVLSKYTDQKLVTLPDGQLLLERPAIAKLRPYEYTQLVALGWKPTIDHLLVFDMQGGIWRGDTNK